MKKNGKKILASAKTLSRNTLSSQRRVSAPKPKQLMLGRYIVVDPQVCHGKPTFRGTRVFVSDVLEMVAEGMAWETIIEQWHGSITKEAIAEAVKLSSEAFFKHTDEFVLEPVPA
jgi:uncharacterized protein (DUF433 family)